jgi:antitoxin FitA
MNFLADESCAGPVVRTLREAGHDVAVIAEVARGATDEQVLERALNEKRVLITEDRDFGELVYARGRSSAGVILVRFDRGALRSLFASDASNAIIAGMAALTIRKLDQKTKTRLRVRAAHHGRSMEEEAREILRSALTTSSRTKGNLAEAIRRRFASFGGIEISLPQRDAVRKAPGFEE